MCRYGRLHQHLLLGHGTVQRQVLGLGCKPDGCRYRLCELGGAGLSG